MQNTFNRERFEAGKVYFLNTQKLGRNSRLVRGYDPEEAAQGGEQFPEMRPDLHSYTIWDTIQNTIEDPALTLYLVLDEAHRGMGNTTRAAEQDKATIVQRLINGTGAVAGIPIVWGISATVERFNTAMVAAEGRSTLPNIVVDSAKVQESGLVKDTIILDIPKEVGHFDTVLVRRATGKITESIAAWAEYGKQQKDANIVKPLMVLQVPNTPDHNEIGGALDTIFQQWPELAHDAVAHVFGEHSTQTFGRYAVPYISPERVQDSTWIRVLLQKTPLALDGTVRGPRSWFPSGQPRTAHTSRSCLGEWSGRLSLDEFRATTGLTPWIAYFRFSTQSPLYQSRMRWMNGGGDGGDASPPVRRVLINPKEMTPNPGVREVVWKKLLSLPSQPLPQRGAKPVKRLTALAHELAADGLLSDAGKKAHAEMHRILAAAQARYADEIAVARKAVLTVEGKSLIANLKDKNKSFDDFWEDADYAVIEDAYRRASRILSADLSRTYAEYLADKKSGADSREDALIEAHADIAALGLVPDVKTYLDNEADKMAKTWLDDYRIPIKSLSDERQEAYRVIKGMSTEPQDIDLAMPKSWMEATSAREPDGSETPVPAYEHHLLCDEDGTFPAEMNKWEIEVLQTEMQRQGFEAWYRNPSRSSQDSLGIAYTDSNKQVKIVRPDFVFFSTQSDRTVVADIVDPHGTQFNDAIPKLQGLAHYAAEHPHIYRRIETVAKIGDTLRVLDLTSATVRKAVYEAKDAKALYEGPFASKY